MSNYYKMIGLVYEAYLNNIITEGYRDAIIDGIKRSLNKNKNQKNLQNEKYILEALNTALKFIQKPFVLESDEIESLNILHHLSMSKEDLIKHILKYKSSFPNAFKEHFNGKKEDMDNISISDSDQKKIMNSIYIANTDNGMIYLSLIDNKLYELFDEEESIESFDFYKLQYGSFDEYKIVSEANGNILEKIKKYI